jgi:hypothetical protein
MRGLHAPARDPVPDTVTQDVLPNELVPTQFAASLARMLSERGLDPAQSTLAAGIGFDVLDPQAAATAARFPRLPTAGSTVSVMTALQDETFGLRRDVGMRPGAFRMMCYCLLGCANLGRAIARICEFHQVFYDGQLEMRLKREGESARFEIVVPPQANALADAGDTAFLLSPAAAACGLSMWHRFFGWLSVTRCRSIASS